MLAPVRRREVAAVPVTQVAVKGGSEGCTTGTNPNDSRAAPEQGPQIRQVTKKWIFLSTSLSHVTEATGK